MKRHFQLVTFVAFKLGAKFHKTEQLAEHLRNGCPVCTEEIAAIERYMEANARERRERDRERER